MKMCARRREKFGRELQDKLYFFISSLELEEGEDLNVYDPVCGQFSNQQGGVAAPEGTNCIWPKMRDKFGELPMKGGATELCLSSQVLRTYTVGTKEESDSNLPELDVGGLNTVY